MAEVTLVSELYELPLSRYGIPEDGELIFAKTFRSSVKFTAADFVSAKCRDLFTTAGKLFTFYKDGVAFCTVEGPTAGTPDADGWYEMPDVVFNDAGAGADVQFDDGNDFTLVGPTPADATGGTLIFGVTGKRIAAA